MVYVIPPLSLNVRTLIGLKRSCLNNLRWVPYSCNSEFLSRLMHRLTARFLLVLLLASVSAPAALALSITDPHVCCRRIHHPSLGQLELVTVQECCRHDGCSLPLTVFLWGGVPHEAAYFVAPFEVTVQSQEQSFHPITFHNFAHSVRGPPTLSVI